MKCVLWFLTLMASLITSCSQTDQAVNLVEFGEKTKTSYLDYGEAPNMKIKLTDTDGAIDIILEITNQKGQLKSMKIMGSPTESTIMQEYFYTKYCDKQALVVVIKQWMNTSIDYGWMYSNVLINIDDGTLLKVLTEGEIKDKETNEIISDGQKQTIIELKSGNQSSSICNLNNN
jgi:hypothetical protein